MEKLVKEINYFIWDGEDSTISEIENYIKEKNYIDYIVKRAINDKTILCIIQKFDVGEMNSYCRINQCVVDVSNKDDKLIIIDKENVNQEFLSKW